MIKIIYRLTPEILAHSMQVLHKRVGVLTKKEKIRSFVYSGLAGLAAIGIVLLSFLREGLLSDASITGSIILLSLLSFAVCIISGRLFYKSRIKNIEETGKFLFAYGFDKNTPKQITFFENCLEKISSYSKVCIYYDELESAVSDSVAFSLIIKGEEAPVCIPKNGQNADTLFSLDNLLREKLGERFIYEM